MLPEVLAIQTTQFQPFRDLILGMDADLLATIDAGTLPPACSSVAEAIDRRLPVQMDGATAVVSLRGPMLPNPSEGWRARGFASTTLVRRGIEAAALDPKVSAIVLDVDSPGGSVGGVEQLSASVRAAADAKPVIAVASGVMASAAYWASAGATEIQAAGTSAIGSIGVIMVLWDTSEAMRADGIRVVAVTTGYAKATGVFGVEITDEQEASVQRAVDAVFDQFRGAVASGRGLDADPLADVSTGEVWFGTQGQAMGLTDGLQTVDDVLGRLRAESATRSADARGRAARARLRLADYDAEYDAR